MVRRMLPNNRCRSTRGGGIGISVPRTRNGSKKTSQVLLLCVSKPPLLAAIELHGSRGPWRQRCSPAAARRRGGAIRGAAASSGAKQESAASVLSSTSQRSSGATEQSRSGRRAR